MNIERKLEELEKGVNFSYINTKKFKDINLYFTFSKFYDRKQILALTFLKGMLLDSTFNYKTKQELSRYTDMLYASMVNLDVIPDVSLTRAEFHFTFVDPKYIDDVNFNDYFEFIKEILFNTYFTNEKFEEIKTIIASSMKRQFDRPNKKAANNAILNLSINDERLKLLYGDCSEELSIITLDDIIETYNDLINNARLDIYLIGDVSDKDIALLKTLPFKKRESYVLENKKIEYKRIDDKEECIKADSSNIIISYKSSLDPYKYGIGKWNLAMGIFGYLPTSLLFEEIREKQSLCYYIFPNEIRSASLINITSNISSKNKELVIKEVERQVQRMRECDFDSNLLEETRDAMISSIYSELDNPHYFYNFLYNRDIRNITQTFKEFIDDYNAATFEDIKKIFKTFKYISTYFLKGE